MSLALYVALNGSDLPSAKQWAEAVRRAGFDVDLDQSFDTRSSRGFRPCPDSNRGFEYSCAPLTASDVDDLNLSSQGEQVLRFDTIVGLHYKTEADFEVAKAASSVLAVVTRGIVIDAESSATIGSDKALAWARGEYEPTTQARVRPQVQPRRISRATLVKLILAVLVGGYSLFRWANP